MRYSLAAPSRFQLEIRKSRFLARAAPVADEAAARAFIASHRAADASHNSWAWKIAAQYRSSDDGEPAGSAGRPILAAIEHFAGDQLVVLVSRWYGGIPLGMGGLIRAYGGCASQCLQAGQRQPLQHLLQLTCQLEHAVHAHLLGRLPSLQVQVLQQDYQAEGIRLLLQLPAEQRNALQQLLNSLSRGQSTLREL